MTLAIYFSFHVGVKMNLIKSLFLGTTLFVSSIGFGQTLPNQINENDTTLPNMEKEIPSMYFGTIICDKYVIWVFYKSNKIYRFDSQTHGVGSAKAFKQLLEASGAPNDIVELPCPLSI